MVKEAIILAGGLGTRLREAVPDLPKCMAPVAGKPFLSYVIDHLRIQGVERFIFSLGYKWGVIEEYLRKEYATLDYTSVIEQEPLGTGGAIQLAIQKASTNNIVIANGDTLFKIKPDEIETLHDFRNSECTLALKPMQNFDRYGVVDTDSSEKIVSFKEKQFYKDGFINGGVYLLNKEKFLNRPFAEKFSFEKDYLEKFCGEGRFFGSRQDGYFIDIGIPEDYRKAQNDLKKPVLDLKKIDKSWTLFLDRDGVINEERLGEYVLHWGEFVFSKGVLEVFKKLSDKFGRVIIISNQRGVGKGLMTEEALQTIHLEMQREVEIVNGKINKIYYCIEKDEKCFNRKPNPGMALQAYKDFTDIDPSKSIMVGNKPSDMKFGRAAGVFTIFVRTTNPDQPFPHPDVDLAFPSLYDFASAL
ncbi:MAG TPA: HAD-IIIA family hydrolase [Flavisolibacter sp.]|jgi:D-glycero-alpha-D-manno-heptose 1-phosphate guanylyltransferase|nr:HAD-IIIA family hydrolase [Flavisolibacter sp.]